MHKKSIAEIYDALASNYENNYQDARVGIAVEAENLFLQELMPYQGLGKVLDCGCGTGMFLDLFNIKNKDYTGIDVSKNMLEIAKKKYPRNTFLKEDVFTHDGNYDFCISLFSIPDYCGINIIKKSFDLLNDNGMFVGTFINKNGSYKKIHCIEESGIEYKPHRFTYSEIKHELHKLGFTWYYILSIVDTTESTDVQKMKNYLINNKHTLAHAKYFFVMAQKNET